MKLEDNKVFIVPYQVRESILKNINGLINIKFFSLDEVIKKLTFDYDEASIIYLMSKYNFSFDVSKNYIDNIYFVDEDKYNNEKLDLLVNLKEDLISQKLLTFNPLFKNFISNSEIIIYGYDYLTKYQKRILEGLNYKLIDKKKLNNKIPLYYLNTLEDEVVFVIEKISELIERNVDLNNIYLLNINSEYEEVIIRLFKMFNIPIDIDISSNLSTTIIGKTVIDLLKEEKDLEKVIKVINEKYKRSDGIVINKIIEIFNKYIGIDYDIKYIIESIKNDFNKTSIKKSELVSMIRTGSLNNAFFSDDDYVFLLGFNQGIVPQIFMDEKYLSDKENIILGLDTINDLNIIKRNSTIDNLRCIKNLTVTLKEKHKDKEYYPSDLVKLDFFDRKEISSSNISYSEIYSSLVLGNMLDEFIKYDYKNKELEKYYTNFPVRYLEYDNKFKGINKENLLKLLNNKLSLSYSSIDNYFRCQFRYYIANILRVDKFEENFHTILGELFHIVLSKIYEDNFDLNLEYESYLKDKVLSSSEMFYLEKLKTELAIIIENIRDFDSVTELKEVMLEKEIVIDKSTEIEVIFKGIIDKIMYKIEDDKTYVALLDYKTGRVDINLDHIKMGIGTQLFVYLYLLSKSNTFSNITFVGFYLKELLKEEPKIDEKKSYLEIKNDNLKLKGFSTSNQSDLKKFDPTFSNSKYISSLKLNKDGSFNTYSKVFDEDFIQTHIDLIDKIIDSARDNILEGNFEINPKSINDKLVGCSYCNFQDLCFITSSDIEEEE